MPTTSKGTDTVTLKVAGMTCGSCERHIKKELDQVAGYRDAQVSLSEGKVRVEYEPDSATPDDLLQAVIRAGYPATVAASTAQTDGRGKATGCGCCVNRPS